MKVWHGTSLENFKVIHKDKALIANKGIGKGGEHKDYIYLGTNYGVAEAFGIPEHDWEEEGSDPYVIIEFDIDENLLVSDPDNNNNNECKNWMESSKKNGLVAVLNKCSISENSIVHFKYGDYFEDVASFSFKDAMEEYNKNKDEIKVLPYDEYEEE